MLVYGKCECVIMQMLYVCVLCASCGSSLYYDAFCMTCSLLHLQSASIFFCKKHCFNTHPETIKV